MLLASIEEIRVSLGFDDMADINFAIMSALQAAEAQLAATLDTDFARSTYSDVFYVSRPPYMDGPAVATEFRLRRGLLQSLVSMVQSPDVRNFSDFSVAVDISSTAQLHAGKGVVRDFVTRYDRSYVQLTYVAGFTASQANALSYDLTQVPRWLQEAAKVAALIAVSDSASLSEAQIKLDKDLLKAQYGNLIRQHLRYAPVALLPL